MNRIIRYLIFLCFVQPLVRLILGVNVRNAEWLPKQGPAIIAANHNSHLDTMVLMALFPLRTIHKVRPVAAADYWLSNRWLSWFSHNIIDVIPIDRERRDKDVDPLATSCEALADGDILIFFPEGSRGDPEELQPFRPGLALLVERFPQTPVIPVFLYGLGKSWPKGSSLFVPFFCQILVGQPIEWEGKRRVFMQRYKTQMQQLAAQGNFPPWQA